MSYKRIIVHENMVKQLKLLRKSPYYKYMDLKDITKFVKIVPVLGKKKTVERRIREILSELNKSVVVR